MVYKLKIIKQELQFEECLKQRLEFICEFAKVTPIFINGSIRKLEKTNLTYIEPHKVILCLYIYTNTMKHFQNRIGFDKDEKYKYVSDDLYKNGIFDSNDNEIANNIYRKVTIPDENKQIKNKRKNNNTRF